MNKKSIVAKAMKKHGGKGGIGTIYQNIKNGVGKYLDLQAHPLKNFPDTTESDNMKKGIMDAARKSSYPSFDAAAPLKNSVPLKMESPTNSVSPLKPKKNFIKRRMTGFA